MSRTKQTQASKSRNQRKTQRKARKANPSENKTVLDELLNWFAPQDELFAKTEFHGNTKWNPEQLVIQALIWSWQESKYVTNAFDQTEEICEDLGLKNTAKSYTSLMNALNSYHALLGSRLRERYQALAEQVGGRFWKTNGWVLMGFDGSRATAARTVSNELAFCAPNYGNGKRAKYGKKKSTGMRRQRNQEQKPQPQAPQVWITMLWHMNLRLPWTWRLGPSNSSERGHVVEMLTEEEFPDNTLFCGDAGFVGYPLWQTIILARADFLVRVGANVSLLSDKADIKKCGGGIVLCWPKGKMNSGEPPLRLRLVKIKVGKTNMWMLTSVLDRSTLTKKQIVRFYKMRWGIEVEFRGLKQTIDKQKLRCRNSDRLLVELDWSLRAMAVAELLALREQISAQQDRNSRDDYDPIERSLAKTMRALRKSMRNLDKRPQQDESLLYQLLQARVQRYDNRTDKRSRYRPKNPDKKPLGDPDVRTMTDKERKNLKELKQNQAA